MGRGDIKTKKGKTFAGSFGKTRKKKKKTREILVKSILVKITRIIKTKIGRRDKKSIVYDNKNCLWRRI